MILESFTQDIRVGLRVLLKDKVFCLLSILVFALGIGGAMTQFTVVNAIVLRGFSFPHPEQLVSVGLIDPKASDQNNNFGIGNIPTAQDYEDLRAAQQSFSQTAGYLSGSTINVTYKNNPQRYTGAYVTEDFFKIIGVSPIMGRDFTAEDNKPPRQCDHCRWYRSGDKCVHPVMKVIRKFPSTKTDPPRCWTMLAAISLNRPRGINDRTRPAYELSRPISIPTNLANSHA